MGLKPPVAGPILDRDKARAKEFVDRMADRVAGNHKPARLRRLPKPKLKRQRHLVIGDSHAHPDDPNHRFEWLGRMVAARKPDVLIDIGDSADMPSLFGYERGANGPSYEGHRYWRDIDAYIDAQERLFSSMGKWRPKRMVKTRGNHEQRIERVAESDPKFEGIIGVHNLEEERFGWEVTDFKEHVEIDGILYTHAFHTPRGGGAIGGVMPARQMILKIPGSHCRVQGHSHLFQFYEEADSSNLGEVCGRKITSIHCGAFFDINSNAHRWAGYSIHQWRSGILELEVEAGQIAGIQFTDLSTIQFLYG